MIYSGLLLDLPVNIIKANEEVSSSCYLNYEDLNRLPLNSLVIISNRESNSFVNSMSTIGIVNKELIGIKVMTPKGFIYIYEDNISNFYIEYLNSSSFLFIKDYQFPYCNKEDLIFSLLNDINLSLTEDSNFIKLFKQLIINNEMRHYFY